MSEVFVMLCIYPQPCVTGPYVTGRLQDCRLQNKNRIWDQGFNSALDLC